MFVKYITGFPRLATRNVHICSFSQIVGFSNLRKIVTATANQIIYYKFAVACNMARDMPYGPIGNLKFRAFHQIMFVNLASII